MIRITLTLVAVAVMSAILISLTYNATSTEEDGYYKVFFPEATSVVDHGYLEVYTGSDLIGYLIDSSAQGYGGLIQIRVSVLPDKSIKSIAILSHSETPGLGSKVTEASFLDQFTGGTISTFKVDTITRATISSTAVIRAAKSALEVLP